jgi:hypothetical protein
MGNTKVHGFQSEMSEVINTFTVTIGGSNWSIYRAFQRLIYIVRIAHNYHTNRAK